MERNQKNCHQLIAHFPMSSAAKQPTLFEVFGRTQSAIVSEINEEALNQVTDVLTSSGEEMGKVVLLRSPRAGYGKTLLLQSMKERLSESFRFFAVEPSGGGRIDGEVVLESILRQLSEILPASGGLTEFDLFARKLLALGLKPLLISGEIPSHDREGALFAIENRPIETFDFHHQQAATAHWTQANFEVLGPRLASELSEISRCTLRGCAYWVDLLFRYATTPPEKVERTRLLNDAVFGDLAGKAGSGAEERLQSLLALLSLLDPVVLVFDETEGLSNQPEEGLKVAAFIVQLRQACPALTVVLSVNEDVWATGLAPLMPGGLADRLTEFEITLEELSRTEAEQLLLSRFGQDARSIAGRMNWPNPLSARAVLREGSRAARSLSAEGAFEAPAPTPVEDRQSAATPPPLDPILLEGEGEGETFQEKAERLLKPTSSFESDAAVGFDAPSAPAQDPRSLPEASAEEPPSAPASSVPSAEQEPFEQEPFAEADGEAPSHPPTNPPQASATPAAAPTAAAPAEASSPFEIVPEAVEQAPEEAASQPAEQPSEQSAPSPAPATPPSSPFAAVAPQTTTPGWSAETAVEHFAASQPASQAAATAPQEEAPSSENERGVGRVFDATTAPAGEQSEPTVSEPTVSEAKAPAPASPFQAVSAQDEQKKREQEAQEAEAQRQRAAQTAATAAESAAAARKSPFEVSEPVAKTTPSVAPHEAPPQQPQVAASSPPASPFEIHQSTSAAAPAPAQETPKRTEAPQTPVKSPAAEQPAQSRPSSQPPELPSSSVAAQAPSGPSSPTESREPVVAKAPESPFVTASPQATSPFASSPQVTPAADREEVEDVEALLNQFKKRFGQKGS